MENIIGTTHKTIKYGDFVVVDYISAKEVIVEFISTKFKTVSTMAHIRSGIIKDWTMPTIFGVGYLGKKTVRNGSCKANSRAYTTWTAMMRRCYSDEYHITKPTYKECTVHKDWHNFQNFLQWYNENYKTGLQLDKDIKIDGNKVYGPGTCLMVTGTENAIKAFAKTYVFIGPDNKEVEVYNLRQFCKDNNLSDSKMCLVNKGERKTHKGWSSPK